MTYRVIKLAGGGAHSDVYEGADRLDRPVCIKLVRPSVGDSKFVLEQAKALARVKSPNVVSVITIEDVVDPTTKEPVPAIIMEWLDGRDLDQVISGPKISLDEARRIGMGVITGMEAIHAAGIVHHDFHFRNVMVGAEFVKIIDILYYDTLAAMTTRSRDLKFKIDRNGLRSMLAAILAHTDLTMPEVDAFSLSLNPDSTLPDIRASFDKATKRTALDPVAQLDFHYNRVVDPAFVDGDAYATALAADTPDAVVVPLITRMIEKGTAQTRHHHYLASLWNRLSHADRAKIGAQLSVAIDREVPQGTWWPYLFMLSGSVSFL